MAVYKAVDTEQLENDLTVVADAIREKSGTSEPLEFPYGMKSAVDAIQSGGIGAVKFIDTDITVEASTTSQVKYTVEDLDIITSAENPTDLKSFSEDDVYVVFITPKEITGVAVADASRVYKSSLLVLRGYTNYTPVVARCISYGSSEVGTSDCGIYSAQLGVSSAVDGKLKGKVVVSVKHQSDRLCEVVAGTYNVQVWHLTSFDWGHGN